MQFGNTSMDLSVSYNKLLLQAFVNYNPKTFVWSYMFIKFILAVKYLSLQSLYQAGKCNLVVLFEVAMMLGIYCTSVQCLSLNEPITLNYHKCTVNVSSNHCLYKGAQHVLLKSINTLSTVLSFYCIYKIFFEMSFRKINKY